MARLGKQSADGGNVPGAHILESSGVDSKSGLKLEDVEPSPVRRPAAHRSAAAFLRRSNSRVDFVPSPAISPGGHWLGCTTPSASRASRGRAEYLAACHRGGLRPLDSITMQLAGVALHIGPVSLSPASAAPLAAGLRANVCLRHLSIDSCPIGDNAGTKLLEAVRGLPLETLVLRRLGLGAEGARTLASLLVAQGWSPRLSTLHLDGNRLADRESNLILEALCSASTTRTSLTDLSLAGNGIGAARPSAAERVAEILLSPNLAGLQRLDLSWNSLCPGDCSLILTAVASGAQKRADAELTGRLLPSCALRCLSLAWNRLGDPGWAAVCVALRCSDFLEHIDLSNCGVPATGILETAAVSACSESPRICQRLSEALEFSLRGKVALRVLRLDLHRLHLSEGAAVRAILDGREPPVSYLARPGVLQLPPRNNLRTEGGASCSWRFWHYSLNLEVHAQRMIAVGLVERARRHCGENWRNERLDGCRFSFSGNWVVPERGVLELDLCNLTEPIYSSRIDANSFKDLRRMLQVNTDVESNLGMLDKLCSRYFLTAQEAFELLFIFSGGARLCAAITLLSAISDRENLPVMLSALTGCQRHELCSFVPNLLLFSTASPAGTYVLDLCKTLDHAFIRILAQTVQKNDIRATIDTHTKRSCYVSQICYNEGVYEAPWNLHLYCSAAFDQMLREIENSQMTPLSSFPKVGYLTITCKEVIIKSPERIQSNMASGSSPDSKVYVVADVLQATPSTTASSSEKIKESDNHYVANGTQSHSESNFSQDCVTMMGSEPKEDGFTRVETQPGLRPEVDENIKNRRPGTAPTFVASQDTLWAPIGSRQLSRHLRPHTSRCREMPTSGVDKDSLLQTAVTLFKHCGSNVNAPFGTLTLNLWNNEEMRWICPACFQRFIRSANLATHMEASHMPVLSDLRGEIENISNRLSNLHSAFKGPNKKAVLKDRVMRSLQDLSEMTESKSVSKWLCNSISEADAEALSVEHLKTTLNGDKPTRVFDDDPTSHHNFVVNDLYDVVNRYTDVARATQQMVQYRNDQEKAVMAKSISGARALSGRATGCGWQIERSDPGDSLERAKWTWGVPISPYEDGSGRFGANRDWRLCKVQFEVNLHQSSAAHTPKMKRLFQSFEAPMIDFRPLPNQQAPVYDTLQAQSTGKDRLAWEKFLVTQDRHSDLLGWLG